MDAGGQGRGAILGVQSGAETVPIRDDPARRSASYLLQPQAVLHCTAPSLGRAVSLKQLVGHLDRIAHAYETVLEEYQYFFVFEVLLVGRNARGCGVK